MEVDGSGNQPLLSHWRRLAGILFEPRRVFEDLSRHPRWILPVVIGVVPSVVMAMTVGLGPLLWLQLDPRGLSLGDIFVPFLIMLVSVVGQFVVQIAFLLLVAFALVGLIRVLGCPLSIRHARAIVSYSLVPWILVSFAHAVFRAGVALLQLESPLPHWFWLNVAAFLDRSASHPFV